MATVSAIVPTYYRNDLLRESVESVRTAAHDDVEVIVVDGSGEEHARSALDDGPDLTYVPLEEDDGPHAARSIGVEHASGAYVQFLDDDDCVVDGKFARQIELLESNSSVGVAYGGFERSSDGEHLPDPDARGDVLARALAWDLSPCCTSTMLIERSLVDRIHPFVHRHGADDLGMMIELATRTRFDYVDDVLVRRGEPVDNLGLSWTNVDGRRQLLDHYADRYDRSPDWVRQSALSKYHRQRGLKLLDDRVWSPRAVASFARALRYAPDPSLGDVGRLCYSVGGRPAQRLVMSSWNRLFERAGSEGL